MKKSNRIIVLVDLTEYSVNLIDFALSFSECIDAKLVFVHQILGMVPAIADLESREEIIRVETLNAYSKLRKLTEGKVYTKDSFNISQNSILSTLNELKDDNYTDWVFAGLKGTGLLKRLFIGSTTLSIINESDLLTVAVPTDSPLLIPKKLIVGVTYKYSLNKPQLNILLSALKEKIISVEFFTLLQEGDNEEKELEHLTELQKEFEAYNSSIFLVKGEDKFEDLKKHVVQSEQPFLVLQQGSRSLEDKLFRKFMINEIVFSGHIPLIVLSK